MDIKKSTGELESFDKNKLCDSLRVAGADESLVNETCQLVESDIGEGAETEEIYKKAYGHLVKKNTSIAARYSIKRGIGALGPAGFHFEQYIETLLQAMGYSTGRNVMMAGECLEHEIDVLGHKENEHVLVEVKYHNKSRIKTHVDVVMYADARLGDIERGVGHSEDHIMWLVTNTKFTGNAIKYAKCRGLRLTGWSYGNYPEFDKGSSLERLVHEHALYPVTVLPAVNSNLLEVLASAGMMLVQDVAAHEATHLAKLLRIDDSDAKVLREQAHDLIFGKTNDNAK